MAGNEDHLEDMLNSEWHKQGACLLRHSEKQEAHCKYAKNCYDETTASRKAYYQRASFKADKYKMAGSLEQSWKHLTRHKGTADEKVYERNTSPTALAAGDDRPEFWDIDKKADKIHKNFPPSGPSHRPYRHQWHHLIPSATLNDYLTITDDSQKTLKIKFLLMKGKYNLNAGRNVVLLPEERQVGVLVEFPVHPNNHPEFNEYAKGKLADQQQRLLKALKAAKGDVHEVDSTAMGNIAESIHLISDDLFKEVEAFGRLEGGREVNELAQFESQIRALLPT